MHLSAKPAARLGLTGSSKTRTSIGCRCRGGDVHSRAVLIARQLCPQDAYVGFEEIRSTLLFQSITEKTYSGGFGPGVPPLPIPNREVKPGRADGTAPQCGRVGRRLLSENLCNTILWRFFRYIIVCRCLIKYVISDIC